MKCKVPLVKNYSCIDLAVEWYIAGQERMVLLDSGAEVSVIDADVAHELGLPISTNVDLGMTQAKAPRTRFVGIAEDVPVSIGRVEHLVPIWVAEGFEMGILLERPYFVQAKVKTDDRGDGSCMGEILSKDGSEVISFQAVAASATENRTRDDLIRSGTLNASAEI